MSDKEFLVFETEVGLFGLNINDIERIVMPTDIFKLPQQEEYVLGVIKIKEDVNEKLNNKNQNSDKLYTLIDFNKKIGHDFCKINNSNKIIIFSNSEYSILVNNVHNIVELEDEDISVLDLDSQFNKVGKIKENDESKIITLISKNNIIEN